MKRRAMNPTLEEIDQTKIKLGVKIKVLEDMVSKGLKSHLLQGPDVVTVQVVMDRDSGGVTISRSRVRGDPYKARR